MAKTYTVKQGDHLPGIAEENGFQNYRILWDHPQNADLKKKRENPNILLAGDQVFIPDPETREESRSTNQKHKFQVDNEILRLRLTLEDLYEKPIAGVPCDLMIEGEIHKLTSNGQGLVELEIPHKAKSGFLVLHSDETPFQEVPIPVKIGHLDPIDTISGQKARLNNLGYFAGDPDSGEDDDFRSAVEEFQCDHSLTVDGKCGANTQSRLKQVCGC
jgi:N-acetylmuramoyl-L-alanine amidase